MLEFMKKKLNEIRKQKKVTLESEKGKHFFKVFSPIENFRVAEYGGEKDLVMQFTQMLKEDDIVYDIGASVGLVTILSAVYVEQGHVVAFEPDPEAFKRLNTNIQLNKLSNVTAFQWAASNENGVAELFTDGAAGFAPSMRQKGYHKGSPKEFSFKGKVNVKMRALDTAIIDDSLPLPTVLKIDVEGAELLCLKGMSDLLNGVIGIKPRLIIIEMHPEFLPSFGSSVEEVNEFICSKGYAVTWKEERGGQIHYCYQSSSEMTAEAR